MTVYEKARRETLQECLAIAARWHAAGRNGDAKCDGNAYCAMILLGFATAADNIEQEITALLAKVPS